MPPRPPPPRLMTHAQGAGCCRSPPETAVPAAAAVGVRCWLGLPLPLYPPRAGTHRRRPELDTDWTLAGPRRAENSRFYWLECMRLGCISAICERQRERDGRRHHRNMSAGEIVERRLHAL